jgi:DNA-binding CsgD family transcriptional regulator
MSFDVPNQGLVKLISEAAFDSSKWRDVCNGLAQLISADGGVIIPFDLKEREYGILRSESMDELTSSYVKNEWYRRDRREVGIPIMLRKGFMTDADVIDYSAIAKDAYYQEFLRPHKLKWFCAFNIQVDSSNWALPLQRNESKNPIDLKDVHNVIAYSEHLNLAASISRQLGFIQIQTANQLMEAHGRAVITLSWGGRVADISALAQAHIGVAFQIVQGFLRAQCEQDRAPLEQILQSLCTNQVFNSLSGPIRMSRGSNRSPLVVYGCALPERERAIFRSAVAILVIFDPERSQDVPAEFLMDYYGFTRAEARLAISLSKGLSVETHAIENATSAVTTRNQLQSLLRKTETHNKAELVAALHRILPL